LSVGIILADYSSRFEEKTALLVEPHGKSELKPLLVGEADRASQLELARTLQSIPMT